MGEWGDRKTERVSLRAGLQGCGCVLTERLTPLSSHPLLAHSRPSHLCPLYPRKSSSSSSSSLRPSPRRHRPSLCAQALLFLTLLLKPSFPVPLSHSPPSSLPVPLWIEPSSFCVPLSLSPSLLLPCPLLLPLPSPLVLALSLSLPLSLNGPPYMALLASPPTSATLASVSIAPPSSSSAIAPPSKD